MSKKENKNESVANNVNANVNNDINIASNNANPLNSNNQFNAANFQNSFVDEFSPNSNPDLRVVSPRKIPRAFKGWSVFFLIFSFVFVGVGIVFLYLAIKEGVKSSSYVAYTAIGTSLAVVGFFMFISSIPTIHRIRKNTKLYKRGYPCVAYNKSKDKLVLYCINKKTPIYVDEKDLILLSRNYLFGKNSTVIHYTDEKSKKHCLAKIGYPLSYRNLRTYLFRNVEYNNIAFHLEKEKAAKMKKEAKTNN